ncbi:hypothetical protein BC830DRAFT_171759 [Chytriomyces sp. MP71]|nr:hypothetical protein BC830DRAFT_865207 [Chytriomyces sp. MP71]KAI8616756.1 hypothetical protein BC830DRAFT_171759 [Chytriomyces sp. MP71]
MRPPISRSVDPAPRDDSIDVVGPKSSDGVVKYSPNSESSGEDTFSSSLLDVFVGEASNALVKELKGRVQALQAANESTESGMKLLVQQYMNLQRELAHWKSVVEWQDNLVASLKSGNQENAVRVQQILKALRSQPTEPVGSQSQSHIAADAASGSINKNLNHATDFSPLILPTNPQPFMGTSSFSNSSPPLNLTGFTYPGIGGCDTGSSLSSMANLTGGGGDLDSLMHVLNFESLGALDFGSSGNAASNIPLIPFQLAPERAGLSGRTMNTASVTSLFQQLKNEQLRQVTSGTVFEPINPPNPRYRALLIEDDLPYQKVFCLHLQKLNIAFDILRTRDQVEQALLPTNAAVLHSYQVVFMDLQMEGIDGPCVARTIRQRGGRQCFIVMSGTQLSPVEFDMYRAAGSSGCLMKPFSPQGLRAALTAAGFVLDA